MNDISVVSPLTALLLIGVIWLTFGVLIVHASAWLTGVEPPDWPSLGPFPAAIGVLWPVAFVCVGIMAWHSGQPPDAHDDRDVPGEIDEPEPAVGRVRKRRDLSTLD